LGISGPQIWRSGGPKSRVLGSIWRDLGVSRGYPSDLASGGSKVHFRVQIGIFRVGAPNLGPERPWQTWGRSGQAWVRPGQAGQPGAGQGWPGAGLGQAWAGPGAGPWGTPKGGSLGSKRGVFGVQKGGLLGPKRGVFWGSGAGPGAGLGRPGVAWGRPGAGRGRVSRGPQKDPSWLGPRDGPTPLLVSGPNRLSLLLAIISRRELATHTTYYRFCEAARQVSRRWLPGVLFGTLWESTVLESEYFA